MRTPINSDVTGTAERRRQPRGAYRARSTLGSQAREGMDDLRGFQWTYRRRSRVRGRGLSWWLGRLVNAWWPGAPGDVRFSRAWRAARAGDTWGIDGEDDEAA